MNRSPLTVFSLLALCFLWATFAQGQEPKADVKENSTATATADKLENDSTNVAAKIDGNGPGWKAMGAADFKNVNCKEDTWRWKDGLLSCNGNCVGVIQSVKQYQNFELVLEWMHKQDAGNSGVFVWTPKSSLDVLEENALPEGIECQVLDHGYTKQYESSKPGRKATWFTTNGDVFPVGASKMTPFPPLSPNGVRSFPSANHSLGFNQWNHYYIRAINGEVRLWVNGHEVSGGNGCSPSTGFVCLEAEGAPIDFRNIKIRILP